MTWLRTLRDERGSNIVEYLAICAIALMIAGAIMSVMVARRMELGQSMAGVLTTITTSFEHGKSGQITIDAALDPELRRQTWHQAIFIISPFESTRFSSNAFQPTTFVAPQTRSQATTALENIETRFQPDQAGVDQHGPVTAIQSQYHEISTSYGDWIAVGDLPTDWINTSTIATQNQPVNYKVVEWRESNALVSTQNTLVFRPAATIQAATNPVTGKISLYNPVDGRTAVFDPETGITTIFDPVTQRTSAMTLVELQQLGYVEVYWQQTAYTASWLISAPTLSIPTVVTLWR